VSRGTVGGRPACDATALELRREFDRSFATAPPGETEDCEDLLAVRVGGEPYALRVRDIAGIERCPGIVPVPSRVPELMGLAGIRGGVVAVYGLASLVGQAGAPEAVRWLVLCGGPELVGLGLAQLEGWLRVPRSELCRAPGEESPGAQPREVVRAGEVLRAVISISSVLENLKARIASSGPPKET
jgi:purine-binding chemotaxis protein CheW